MTNSDGFFLGLLQGFTEFLPVSSSGHLVLLRGFLNIDDTTGLAFDAVLHIATTLAVILYFRKDLWLLLQTFLRYLGKMPVDAKNMTLLKGLTLATIPAALAGLFLDNIVEFYLQNDVVVAVALLATAVIFMVAEWYYATSPQKVNLTTKSALFIGLAQMFALIPGISRSGITLSTGMFLGLTRIESARFSFLLAIPITLAAGSKKLLDLLTTTDVVVNWAALGLAALTAFVVALFVIHFFLNFIRKYTLWPFIWYIMILSGVTFYLVFVGGLA